jgi:predicted transcriptional regulator
MTIGLLTALGRLIYNCSTTNVEEAGMADDIVLSDLQYDLMRVLWQAGEQSVADATAALAERDLAHTTVATLLTRLEKRGVVSSRRDGRMLLYRPCVSEAQVRRSMVSSLIAQVFRGDPKALLAHLISEREVAPGDLEQVRALLRRDDEEKAQ